MEFNIDPKDLNLQDAAGMQLVEVIRKLANESGTASSDYYVTPQMFGAKGDGVTDDTDAVLACFDEAIKNVHFPSGEYIVKQTITVPDGTKVSCDGTIIKSGVFDVLFSVGDNCDIQLNIDIDKSASTSASSQSSADIYVVSKTGTTIHDTKISNTDSRYAIWVEKSTSVSIERCIVDTYVYIGIGLRDGNSDVKIVGNTVLNGHGTEANRYAICLNSSTSEQSISKNIICTGNYIEDQNPKWEGIDAHDLSDSVISNNVIVNTLSGISVVVNYVASNNIVVSGNVYRCTKELNIDASTYGITVSGVTNSNNIVVTGNALYGCGNNTGTSDKGGIKSVGINDIIISDNVINCVSGNGIRVASVTGSVTENFRIFNNTIYGATNGIKADNGSGILIVGEIKENILNNCTVGISGNEQNGPPYQNCIYAKDNTYVNCTTNFNNNTKGMFVSPGYALTPAFGRVGMVIDSLQPQKGVLRSMCTASAGESAATWVQIFDTFPICGTYTLSSGYAAITDDRITATSYCVVTNMYVDNDSKGQIVTAQCVNKRINVYVKNHDGTDATGSVTLAILIILAT